MNAHKLKIILYQARNPSALEFQNNLSTLSNFSDFFIAAWTQNSAKPPAFFCPNFGWQLWTEVTIKFFQGEKFGTNCGQKQQL